MTQTPFFSSFLFRMGLECPTRLYYERHSRYPTDQADQELINHIKFNKRQLTELARCCIPVKASVPRKEVNGNITHELDSMNEQEEGQFFNAVVEFENLYYRAPILIKNGDKLEVYRVRSKTFNPQKHRFAGEKGKIYSKWKSYFEDLAFGTYVIEQRFPDYTVYPYLVLPDKTQRARRNLQDCFNIGQNESVQLDCSQFIEPKEEIAFLRFIPVDSHVRKIMQSRDDNKNIHPAWENVRFEDRIAEMVRIYDKGEKYPPVLDMHCRSCPFRVSESQLTNEQESGFQECWSDHIAPEQLNNGNHIFELTGHGTESFLRQNILTLEQVPLPEGWTNCDQVLESGDKISFNQRQVLQILGARGADIPREFVKNKLFDEMNTWDYPLFFLDFEAANFAVPFRAGSRPYESLVFQYSCHVLFRSGKLRHYDWIEDHPGAYPNYELFRNLKRIPSFGEGTILQYSPFEKQMFKEIRRILKNDMEHDNGPSDQKELKKWLDRLLDGEPAEERARTMFVDMSRLVREYYFNRVMDGSFGLKDVVAAIFKTSDILRNRYSGSYQSRNFSPVQWWQPSDKGKGARDPYKIIEEQGKGISKGDEALMAFVRLQRNSMSDEERKKLSNALLKYCELDTLSMVMLYEHWQGMNK